MRYRDGYDKPKVWMEPGKVLNGPGVADQFSTCVSMGAAEAASTQARSWLVNSPMASGSSRSKPVREPLRKQGP